MAARNVVPLSVLLPWNDRSELEYTLRENRAAFEAAGAEVLILNCGGDQETVLQMLRKVDLRCLRLIETGLSYFNKSCGLNLGAHFARAPKLMMLDADILMDPDLMVNMLQHLTSGSFVTVQWMQESSLTPSEVAELGDAPETIRATVMEFALPGGSRRNAVTFRYSLTTQCRSGQSLMLVDKGDFIAVNGFHSGISSWGWEDNDLCLRLQWSVGLTSVEHGIVKHLSHDDVQRELRGKSQMESLNENLLAAAARYRNGDLQGTYTSDNKLLGNKAFEVDIVQNRTEDAWQM